MLDLTPLLVAGLVVFGVPPALLDASSDEVLHRAFVPSDEKPQGEVRLLRRGDGHVVQTLLYSKLLKRAVGKIVDKERGNWPESSPGHGDSVAYTGALVTARETVAAEFKQRRDTTDRRQALLIEFVLTEEAGWVAIALPTVEVVDESWRVVDRRELRVLELGASYVRTNMRLIVVDALGLDAREAEARVP